MNKVIVIPLGVIFVILAAAIGYRLLFVDGSTVDTPTTASVEYDLYDSAEGRDGDGFDSTTQDAVVSEEEALIEDLDEALGTDEPDDVSELEDEASVL